MKRLIHVCVAGSPDLPMLECIAVGPGLGLQEPHSCGAFLSISGSA